MEVIGAPPSTDALSCAQVRRLCVVAGAAAGVWEGHVAIEFVKADRIAELNAEHRGQSGPTDVLSFPIDGAEPAPIDGSGSSSAEGLAHPGDAPRELGDVVICPEHTVDLREAIVHGVLHLVGMDHETDSGEMLALQSEILRWEEL